MNISIRKANLDDTLSLIETLSGAVEYKVSHKDDSWGSEPFSEREVRRLIKTGDTYVVELYGEIIGTFGLDWDDEKIWGKQPPLAGYIHRLAIKNGFHGQNIGGRVLDWASSSAAKNYMKFLRLDCDSRNVKLCSYYEKEGFKLVGQKMIPSQEDYYANLYERSVT